MLEKRFQIEIDKANQLNLNQQAKRILEKKGEPILIDEMHALQLLRFHFEEGSLPYELRLGVETEPLLFELMDMQTWNPRRLTRILEMNQPVKKVSERAILEELLERAGSLHMEKVI